MKKLLCLFIAAGGILPTITRAQNMNYSPDSLLSRWVIDINLLGGGVSQTFNTESSTANYLNPLNMNAGHLNFRDGYSFGGDAQLGFFFGKKRHFGIGLGVLYMQQYGDAVLNNYHAEYEATDRAGNIYRQVVTGDDIRESIVSTNLNIPLVLKYKNRFSKHWGFTADAGALFNLQMNNAYTTHASFNYEAIYKLQNGGDGGTVSVYDNSPVPSVNDWFITQAEFLKNNPGGNYLAYINAKRALGYNVGEGLAPRSTTGSTSYNMGSVGFIFQPSFNYFLSDHVALNFGAYYMLQPFKNNALSNYRLQDGIGSYSPLMNSVTSSINQSYGLNVGVRFFLGKKAAPMVITSIDQNPPSYCGLCDGSMALHGLPPNKEVTVDYSVNGAQPTTYSATVQPDGQVKIPNLCAGTYTGIDAKVKRKHATAATVTLSDPPIRISSQTPANPSAQGTTDGSVTFYGLKAGKPVTVNYNLNGTAQPTFTGVVNQDNSLTIPGLGVGNYSGVVIKIGNCRANAADFALNAPAPPPPPPAPAPQPQVEDGVSVSTPILFDFNKTTVHRDSYPVLKEAAKEMKEDPSMKIRVDGYTDTIGTAKYNKILSLKRAKAVKKDLAKMGVNPRRVKTVGHGSKQPVEPNNTAEGRHEDRRAVMHVQQ